VRSKLFGSAFRRRIGFRIRLADDNAPFQQDSLSERKQVAPARIVPFETSDRVVAQFQSLFPIGVTHRLGPPLFRGWIAVAADDGLTNDGHVGLRIAHHDGEAALRAMNRLPGHLQGQTEREK